MLVAENIYGNLIKKKFQVKPSSQTTGVLPTNAHAKGENIPLNRRHVQKNSTHPAVLIRSDFPNPNSIGRDYRI